MLSFVASAPELLRGPGAGEALSGIFGSVSLAAWICLLVGIEAIASLGNQWLTVSQLPQLIANYKAKSADALSMKFLMIWLLGDIANLSGS